MKKSKIYDLDAKVERLKNNAKELKMAVKVLIATQDLLNIASQRLAKAASHLHWVNQKLQKTQENTKFFIEEWKIELISQNLEKDIDILSIKNTLDNRVFSFKKFHVMRQEFLDSYYPEMTDSQKHYLAQTLMALRNSENVSLENIN
jgi:hypothetical protein